MDFYRVLEDYSVEALLNYEDSASDFPIIDDNGILAFLADAREGVVVGTLSVQVPKLSPKLVYLLTRMSTQALDYDNHIITSGGETEMFNLWFREPNSVGELLIGGAVSFIDILRAQHGILMVDGGYFSALPIETIRGSAELLLKSI